MGEENIRKAQGTRNKAQGRYKAQGTRKKAQERNKGQGERRANGCNGIPKISTIGRGYLTAAFCFKDLNG
jgi:hypothetical protein